MFRTSSLTLSPARALVLLSLTPRFSEVHPAPVIHATGSVLGSKFCLRTAKQPAWNEEPKDEG